MCPKTPRAFRLLLFFLLLCLSASGFIAQAQEVATHLHQAVTNGRIAYATTSRRGQYRIYVANADGSRHFELLNDGAADRRPSWSPDGTKLAFDRNRRIFIVNHDGTGLHPLSATGANETAPSWSPDGTRLVFIRNNDLHTSKADGTDLQRLTNLSAFFYDVAWSPAGTKLLFIAGGRLQTCNPDGTGVTTLLPTTNVLSASWSPDGTRIVITTGNDFPGGGAIQIVNADGSGLTRLTNGVDYTPVFSPDGAQIAFVRGTQLFTMNADGSGAAPVPDTNIGTAFSVGSGTETNPGLSWQRVPDAPAPLSVFSGRVTDAAGRGLAGRVDCNDRAVRTDRDGYYSCGNLAGSSFTVSLNPLFFTPPQGFATIGTAVDSRLDFIAQPIRHTISGRITDSANAPLRGVAVALAGNYFTVFDVIEAPRAVTDENGFYRLTNVLPRDGTEPEVFSVQPSSFYAFFTPFAVDVPRLTGDLTVNFMATRQNFSISGRAVDASDQPVSGATITLAGGRAATTTTGADGQFTLNAVPGGFDYTVTASKAGVTFTPATRNLKLLSANPTLLFRSGIGQLTLVSPASFQAGTLANEALVTAFGTNLATTSVASSSPRGETSLGGVRVEIEDFSARGVPGVLVSNPRLLFASPTQLNLDLSLWSASGEAVFTVFSTATGRALASGSTDFAAVAPALFAANNNGQGVAAAVALRVAPGNRQTYEAVARFDNAANRFVTQPIDLGPAEDEVYLVLYGLGVKNRSTLEAVTCLVGGVDAPVTFAGRAPGFLALDQINVRLPRALVGRGEVDVVLTVDGKVANTVRVAIK